MYMVNALSGMICVAAVLRDRWHVNLHRQTGVDDLPVVLPFDYVFAVVNFLFFQAEAGIRDHCVTGVQTCALPICRLGRASIASAIESLVCVFGFFRSAPALNAPPASSPVRTTQRMSLSSSSCGSISFNAAL